LGNAHVPCAWAWDAATKRAYYNDLTDADHLLAVRDSVNQAKGDKGPEARKPPYTGDWCRYATDWATIKKKWSLTVTQAEYNALASMLTTCYSARSLKEPHFYEQRPFGNRRSMIYAALVPVHP
jgi:hypothetical protein